MPYNKKAVLAANTQAIRIVLRLEKEQRLATEEERFVRKIYNTGGTTTEEELIQGLSYHHDVIDLLA